MFRNQFSIQTVSVSYYCNSYAGLKSTKDAHDKTMCSHRYTSDKSPRLVYSDFRDYFPLSSLEFKMYPEANKSL